MKGDPGGRHPWCLQEHKKGGEKKGKKGEKKGKKKGFFLIKIIY